MATGRVEVITRAERRRRWSPVASAPEELTAYAGLISTPEGMPAVAVIACHCGDPADAGRAMQPLREFGSPLVDGIQRMPFPAMQKLLDDAFPDRAYN